MKPIFLFDCGLENGSGGGGGGGRRQGGGGDIEKAGLVIAKCFYGIWLLSVVSTAAWKLSVSPDISCGRCTTREAGNSINFTCAITSEDNESQESLRFRWRYPDGNVIIPNKNNGAHNRTHSVLSIKDIEETDAGEYVCELIASTGKRLAKKSTTLVVISLSSIRFVNSPDVQYPTKGKNALIKCQAKGQPQPVITWYLRGSEIHNGGRYRITQKGLRIRRVSEDDDGVYVCRADIHTYSRHDSKNITIISAIPPTITKPLNDAIGLSGTMHVKCQASGKPSPRYRWTKQNGDPSVQNPPKFIVDPITGTLTVNHLVKTDEGTYICIATNPVGATIATFDVINITENVDKQILSKSHHPGQPSDVSYKITPGSEPESKEEDDKNSHLRWIIPVAVATLLIFIGILISFICYRRRKTKKGYVIPHWLKRRKDQRRRQQARGLTAAELKHDRLKRSRTL